MVPLQVLRSPTSQLCTPPPSPEYYPAGYLEIESNLVAPHFNFPNCSHLFKIPTGYRIRRHITVPPDGLYHVNADFTNDDKQLVVYQSTLDSMKEEAAQLRRTLDHMQIELSQSRDLLRNPVRLQGLIQQLLSAASTPPMTIIHQQIHKEE